MYDAANNARPGTLYSKVSATIVINEIMWSSSGSSLTQYVELRNLGASSVDISGFKIDNAATDGTSILTLPGGQTIAGGGYYLIAASAPSTVGNALADPIVPNYVGALSLSSSQVGNLVLKSSTDSVYDRAKANPFPAGDDASVVSMERHVSPADGLADANWYSAQTGSGFFDAAGSKGTPGSPNVFDAAAPTISSVTPTDGRLAPTGNLAVTYAYSDETAMDPNPVRTFLLEKNDGSGNYSDVTAALVASSGANAANASFTLSGASYGAYRATFSVRDAAGNQAQKISTFYVDQVSMDVSTGSLSVGTLQAGIPGQSSELTVTVSTVGAPFALTLGGSGSLSAGYDSIAGWDGSYGYAYECAVANQAGGSVCDGTKRAITGATLEDASGNLPDVNGNLKTYTYRIRLDARVDALKSAGNYDASALVGITFGY